FNVNVLAARVLDSQHVCRFHLIGRDVDFAVVYQNVPVIDELTRLAPRGRKTRAIDGVIQPALKQEQEILTRDPLLSRSPFEVISELPLENKVDPFHLL